MNRIIDSFSKKRIALMLIALMFGFSVGMMIGTLTTLGWVANKAIYFLDLDLDEKALANAFLRYKSQIDSDYPSLTEDALNDSNQGE